MRIQIEEKSLPDNQRIIVISDIHGNLSVFSKLLKKICFCNDDLLFIAGDFIEKGPRSLETLRFVQKLSANPNVFIVRGNCDITPLEFLCSPAYDEYILKYMLGRNNLLKDMCLESGIELNEQTDLYAMKATLREAYADVFDWLADLPDVIVTEKFIFVHAGLPTADMQKLSAMDTDDVNSFQAFAEKDIAFDKYIIVGHWPVSIYNLNRIICNPIVDETKKIISVDGGNVLNKEGQINAFIINSISDMVFSQTYEDDLETITASQNQTEQEEYFAIAWLDNMVRILESGAEFSNCEHISSGRKILIPNDMLYHDNKGDHAYAVSNYLLPVTKGEQLSLVRTYSDRYLAKKNGEVGWVMGKPAE